MKRATGPGWLLLIASSSCGGDDSTARSAAPDAASSALDGAPDVDGGGQRALGLSIAFDYRFDDARFLTSSARRGVLEAAARQWGYLLGDDFGAIPAGTSIRTRDPELPDETGQTFASSQAIDDVLIFVGCADLDGPGGVTARSNSAAAIEAVTDPALREQLRDRYQGRDFEPWTGWISFDCQEAWFFDTTPETDGDLPTTQLDFLSVAMHEIGHVLGFGTAVAFRDHIAANAFTGPAAMAVHGGVVPTTEGGVHWTSDVESDGHSTLMDPSRSAGMRTPPTRLDAAGLADIGYQLQ